MGKGSGSGSGTNTVVQNSSPPQVYLDAYQKLLQEAQSQQAQPLQQYSGTMVAPFNDAQNQAFADTGTAATALSQFGNPAAPYINSAADSYNQATQPLWSSVQQFSQPPAGGPMSNGNAGGFTKGGGGGGLTSGGGGGGGLTPSGNGAAGFTPTGTGVDQYLSPYIQDVVGATQQQFNQSNQIQQNQLAGNAINQGAFGGDRAAVAQGVLAGQQQLNEAPVISGLYNQGYGQALGEFNQQQTAQLGANQANAWLNSQAAAGMGQLGQQAFNTQLGGINANLAGANANLGIGAIQQAQAQQELNVPYEQFVQQQAYPWQTIGWLGGITQGLGTSAGGNASTNYPSPSVGGQVAGALLGGAGIAGATGAFGSNGWLSNAFSGSGGGASAPVDYSQYAAGARGGRIAHRADGGIVIPFPRRHAAGGGIVAANDDYNDVPVPMRARGGGFGMPDISLSYVPSGGGIVGGGDAATGPRMLSGHGSTSSGPSMPQPGSGGFDPSASLAQMGAKQGLKSLLKGSPDGSLPGSSGTYASPGDAPGGITWNATDPAASPTDLSTGASAQGLDAGALTSADVGTLDAAQIAALGGDATELAALGTTAAEVGTAAEIGSTVAELAPLILLARRGGRIPRHAPGGGIVAPHLSPLQSGINTNRLSTAYVPPNPHAGSVQIGPSPVAPAPAAAPPATLTDTSPHPDGATGNGGADGATDGNNDQGSNGGGASDTGGGDGGGGERRGGWVHRRADGGIIGYDDGGDVESDFDPRTGYGTEPAPTQVDILRRAGDPARYRNDPLFSSKLVQDEIARRSGLTSPATVTQSSPQRSGPRYTARRPPPGPGSMPQDPDDPTADTSPFLGYRNPVRSGAVPQRRDPTYTMPPADEPDLGSPEQQYTASPAAPYSPGPDADWPPPDLPQHGQGIVADGGGQGLPPPPGVRPDAPQGGGIAPPSRYVNSYAPREASGRSKEARELAPWMALIEGGGSMLASRSPHFGVALGEGLKGGAKSYGESRKEADRMAEREDEQRDTGNYHKSSLDMQAQHMSDAAEQAKATLQATTKHYADTAEHQAATAAETTRHNKVQEGKGYSEPVRNLTNPDGSPVVDKDGVPQALWMDRTNNRTYQGPAPDPAVMGAGRGKGGGATSDLVQHLLNEGTVKTWQEGMAMVRDPSGKNASTLKTATERLALQAAKSDPEYQSDAKATIDRWRAYYGAGTGPANPGGNGGVASPKTQADFEALPSGALYINPADGAQYRKK